MSTVQRYAVRQIDDEQYDILVNDHHIGTVMDKGDGYSAHAFCFASPKVGRKETKQTLDEAIEFILEYGS